MIITIDFGHDPHWYQLGHFSICDLVRGKRRDKVVDDVHFSFHNARVCIDRIHFAAKKQDIENQLIRGARRSS
jgi:hypothetical protein